MVVFQLPFIVLYFSVAFLVRQSFLFCAADYSSGKTVRKMLLNAGRFFKHILTGKAAKCANIAYK